MSDTIDLNEVKNMIADAWAGQKLLNQIEQLKQEKGAEFRSRELLEYMRDNEVYDIKEAYSQKYGAEEPKPDTNELDINLGEQKEAPDREVGAINKDNLAEKVSEFLTNAEQEDQ